LSAKQNKITTFAAENKQLSVFRDLRDYRRVPIFGILLHGFPHLIHDFLLLHDRQEKGWFIMWKNNKQNNNTTIFEG
jgi:hypothetical protein